ncbi:MAG: tRNA-(ms[2]io[6]A)-hydroxylase [Myxococcales bacterium]|nr:tRNA-(ms[2]io[6]A)-hydroxylase [Myxococcales bacterium]
MGDFDSFLQDHANCERKASSMAMSFVSKYPDRVEIIPELIETALEELNHFRQVYQVMQRRGVQLPKQMGGDPYVGELVELCRHGVQERFLDRLVVAAVVEARGAERFRLIAEALEETDLKKFYDVLWRSEARHGDVFLNMASCYFSPEEIQPRLDFFVGREASILSGLVLRPALH